MPLGDGRDLLKSADNDTAANARIARFNLLFESLIAVSRARDIQETARIAAKHLRWLVDFDRAFFVFHPAAGSDLDFICCDPSGVRTVARDCLSEPEQKIFSESLISRQIEFSAPDAILSFCVPLNTESRNIGAVICSRKSGFSPHDIRFVEALSAFLSVTMEKLAFQNELELSQASLERRVSERTVDLENSNRMLEETTQNLSKSLADLELFARISSHDLKEPLRTITMFLGMLKKTALPKLDSREISSLQYALNGAIRLNTLLEGLLKYTTVGSRQRGFEKVDLNKLVADVLRNIDRYIQETSTQITLNPLPVLECDPSQISQVFQNLVTNAIKFRSEKAPIIVIDCKATEDEWHFSVRDNGIGLDMQYAKRILEPFQRLHTTDQYEGSGLGLSVCQKIIAIHAGRIWVESKLGEGATFHFTFPKRLSADG